MNSYFRCLGSRLSLFLIIFLAGCSSHAPLDRPPPDGFQPFYQPQDGETLAQIAGYFNLSEAELARFNPRSQESPLSSQRALRIPERSQDVPAQGPYYYRIQPGDTLSRLAQHFHIALLSLIQANPGIQPERLRVGQRLVIPVEGRDLHQFRWPVEAPQVKINFSHQRWGVHQGLALQTQAREEIFPIAPGRVVFAGQVRGFGRVVILDHRQNKQSIYAYCYALFVEEGNRLSGRHPVCSAGQQRQIDQPGIYLELRSKGQPVAPENYLPALPW